MLLPLLFLQFDETYEWEARSGGFGESAPSVVFSRDDYYRKIRQLEKPIAEVIKKVAKRKRRNNDANALRDELAKIDAEFDLIYLQYIEYLRDKELERMISREIARINRERALDDEIALLLLM